MRSSVCSSKRLPLRYKQKCVTQPQLPGGTAWYKYRTGYSISVLCAAYYIFVRYCPVCFIFACNARYSCKYTPVCVLLRLLMAPHHVLPAAAGINQSLFDKVTSMSVCAHTSDRSTFRIVNNTDAATGESGCAQVQVSAEITSGLVISAKTCCIMPSRKSKRSF